MTFEEKLIKAGTVRQKSLLIPSKKASSSPDTGVTILKKSAYFVIRDCADVTQKYLSHLMYGSLNDPINHLKGLFTQAEIIDFVGRSKEDRWTKQLLNIILTDIGTLQYRLVTGTPTDGDAAPITSPVFVGFVFGPETLGGLLAGVTVCGVLMAIFQSNAGGAWDNAKKMIEEGVKINGETLQKGSDAHKAAVVGDTVGDPFKDTSGPSLNILIKLMSVVSLVIAPLIANL